MSVADMGSLRRKPQKMVVVMAKTLDRPVPQAGILNIDPYVPGKSAATGKGRVFKLSANENPLGPSPKAVQAYNQSGAGLALYPDGAATELREALASQFGLNPDHIVCGAGSDEILNLLAQAFLGPGDEAIYSQYGFLVYPIAIQARSATPVVAPEQDYRTNVDAILGCVSEKTKMVFLANPNNPTGTYIPIDEVRRLHAGLPKHVVLVLDAAYAEFVRRNDYEAGIELVSGNKNVVMTRTFSKIYGLAALRLGWCYCPPEIADFLNRIRGPFNVSRPAMDAGIAALKDASYTSSIADFNEVWISRLTEAIRALGLDVTTSVGNFLLIHFPNEGPHTAAKADSFLSQRGLILRGVGSYGLPNALRLSIGTEEANGLVVEALRTFLDGSDT